MKAINPKKEAKRIDELHQYKIIAQMNNYNFTLIRAENRTLDFHTHEHTDEVFYVLEGRMVLELRDKTIELNEGDMFVVPKGAEHRPVCKEEVSVMLIEPDGTLTPDNTGGTYKP